jgi:S1-C subfamily serine protease
VSCLRQIASLMSVVISLVTLSCTHGPESRFRVPAPECIYAPDPADDPPIDPFEMDGDSDGMSEQERLDFIKRGVAATVQVRVRRYSAEKGYTFHSGSGVFISDSLVLTAEHVMRDAEDSYAILRRIVRGGLTIGHLRWERVELLRSCTERDVALLHIHCPPEMARPLPIAKNWRPREGELVWQFGNRTGWSRGRVVRRIPDNDPSATHGMVQVRMMGQRGDSGGPVVVSNNGELVGLVLRGNSDQGRQFFVPIDVAMRSVGLEP